MEVLIVEDDYDIAELLKVNLKDIELDCEVCHRGDTAVDKIINNNYALIILDLSLPGKSGLEICREVRVAKPLQPILMLTAKSSELDQIIGLEVGADDYITKPFSIPSLQARVRTRIKRSQYFLNQSTEQKTDDNSKKIIERGDLRIDIHQRSVTVDEFPLELTALEFELLAFFASHPGKVYSRTQLLDKVWGYNHDGYEHTVNSNINRLRTKLQIAKDGEKIIQTVWGVGYKLNEACCFIESE